jgi:carbon-monoxide dehydrogenase medium subunit
MTKIPPFAYDKPNSVEEAIRLLTQYGESAKPLAGGTDLLIQMKHGLALPRHLVSLNHISELADIIEDDVLKIGALATHSKIVKYPLIESRFPILFGALSQIGSHQIRNVATIGGNICNAAPSADSLPALLALEARLCLKGPQGKREIDLEGFLIAPGQTAIQPGEILTSILLPFPSRFSAGMYIKHTRRGALDLPIIGVAVQCTFGPDFENIEKACIGLGVAAPTPIRARAAEAFLAGKPVKEEILKEAGRIASQEAKPRDSWRGSASYRSEMIRVLVGRAILLARERLTKLQKGI